MVIEWVENTSTLKSVIDREWKKKNIIFDFTSKNNKFPIGNNIKIFEPDAWIGLKEAAISVLQKSYFNEYVNDKYDW